MDEDWWVRRVVLALLLVVGIGTAVFAVFAVRVPDDGTSVADPVATDGVTGDADPEEELGPLRRAADDLEGMVVVGRQGSPVDRPAHTRESYEAAVEAGADFIETEVVVTQDGALVARADHELSISTDVADRPEFADRFTTKNVDGVDVEGWFSEDFTLDELLTLRAVEAEPELRPDSATYDGELELLTLAEVADLVIGLSERTGRQIGLFVQPRHARYFRDIGLSVERPIANSLGRSGLTDDPGRVVVESPDTLVLEKFEAQLGADVLTAVVIGADQRRRLEDDILTNLPRSIDALAVEVGAFAGQDPYDLVERVHDAGFAFAVWPISFENDRLAAGFRDGDDPAARGNLDGQVSGLVMIGVDIILADAPADVLTSLQAVG